MTEGYKRIPTLAKERGQTPKEMILEATQRYPSLTTAARELNISPVSLWKWMKRLGIRFRTVAEESHT